MTTPPTPRTGGFVPPVGKAAGAAPARSGTSPSSAGGVSPMSVPANQLVKHRLLAPRERILIAGDSNSGKSFVYYRMALNALADPANWAGAAPRDGEYTGPKFFIVDTDDTSPTFMSEGREFEVLYADNGGNVYPYPAFNWGETRKAVASIIAIAKRGDWIVIDLLSRVYDQARDYVANLKGFDRSDEAIKRSMENKGFGEGETNFWSVASMTHDSVSTALLLSDDVAANILGLAHTTDMVPDRERREIAVMFDDIGIKPRGRPQIPGQMNTVVVLWSQKVFERDERGKRKQGGKEYIARYFDIVKDRGEPFYQRVQYDMDFYNQLKAVRREHFMAANLPIGTPLSTVIAAEPPTHNVETPQLDAPASEE